VVVEQLQTKLADAQSTQDQLAASKIREAALENQLQQLLEELRQAKSSHTPVRNC